MAASFLMAVASAGTAVATGSTFTVFGMSTFMSTLLVNTAMGLAMRALAPSMPAGAGGVQISGATGSAVDHPIIYGRAKVGGVRTFDVTTGDQNKYLHRVLSFAGHEIQDYQEIYINDMLVTGLDSDGNVSEVTDSDGETSDRFDGFITIKKYYGTDGQVGDPDLISATSDLDDGEGKWTSAHRLQGIAYLYVKMKASSSKYPNGVPKISAVIQGKKVFDPRQNKDVWSDNPALCALDFMTQPHGMNTRIGRVSVPDIIKAANICDELVDGKKRYTCNGSFLTGGSPDATLDPLLTSMGGAIWYAQGKFRCKAAKWTSPVYSFDENQLMDQVTVGTRRSRMDNFNVIKGKFKGEETNWFESDYPSVTDPSFVSADNGIVNNISMDFPFTSDSITAQRLAKIFLFRNREQITFESVFDLTAMNVQVGDVVQITNDRFGWSSKTFEVFSWSIEVNGGEAIGIKMALSEISEDVFNDVDGSVFELNNTMTASPYSVPPLVTTESSNTLINKTIDGATNTISNVSSSSVSDFDEAVEDLIGANVVSGTGVSVAYNDATGQTTVSNTLPDQTVTLTEGSNVAITGTYPDFTISSTGGGTGTVSSVAATVPTGFSVSGSPITTSGTIALSYASGYQGYTSSESTKLSNIEAGANVTDTANVTAAGALMDTEVTNLAQVKGFDSADYATAAQGTLADSAIQTNDSPTFGDITASGDVTVDTTTLHVDSTNHRVGIGTITPNNQLNIQDTGDVTVSVKSTGTGDADATLVLDASDTGEALIQFRQDGVDKASIEYFQGGSPDLNIRTSSGTDGVIDLQPNDVLTLRAAEDQVSITGDLSVTGTITSTGIDVTGNATFADNGKAIFGAGSDLQIYHDGSNSYVDAAGVGHLVLQSQGDDKDVRIKSDDSFGGLTDYIIVDGSTGQVKLRYYGDARLNTTSTGVDVSGTITSDGLTVGGNVDVTGTVDGRDVATDGTKLDGIEAGATADQTAAQLLTAIKTVDGVGSGLDADLLDGLHESTFMRRSANSGLDMNNNNITDVEDIYLQDRIYHDGDNNTYMQFHAADQWRVVTGGTERLEVKNTYTTIQNKAKFTYVNWDNSGENALRNSHQVSSVSDLATGSFRTNFSSAFPAATYAPAGMSNTSGGSNIPAIGFNTSTGTNYTTTACGHSAEDVDGGYTDYDNNCVMYIGG
jgi:hypothetical protein